MAKARLSEIAKQLSVLDPTREVSLLDNDRGEVFYEANPVRGDRGDFLRLTVTMSPQLMEGLELERLRRKKQGLKNNDISSLIRHAVAKFLNERNSN